MLCLVMCAWLSPTKVMLGKLCLVIFDKVLLGKEPPNTKEKLGQVFKIHIKLIMILSVVRLQVPR
jgi:hypothetical protein